MKTLITTLAVLPLILNFSTQLVQAQIDSSMVIASADVSAKTAYNPFVLDSAEKSTAEEPTEEESTEEETVPEESTEEEPTPEEPAATEEQEVESI
jgi:outer membrane biosynthesis protein TonB